MSQIKAIIETEDKEVLAKLQPIVDMVRNYDGHLNASYHLKNSAYDSMDLMHKRVLTEKIKAVNPGFIIGTGGSHIWVALHTACRVDYSSTTNPGDKLKVIPGENIACDIHDRVLLIVDSNN